jgi:hypothetical protein
MMHYIVYLLVVNIISIGILKIKKDVLNFDYDEKGNPKYEVL